MMDNPDNISDKQQPNDANHDYCAGYQDSVHLPPSLERRIASDAPRIAGTARASRMAEEARRQAVNMDSFPIANAVAFAGIGRSLARSEASTWEPDSEAIEIENWKGSEDAARIRADLDAARRQTPETEGEPETGGVREKIVPRTEAGSGEMLLMKMRSAAWADMLGAQSDSDAEEMEGDAAWPRKIEKKRNEDGQDDGSKQGILKKQAFGLDGADKRNPSPDEIPLPHSRAASAASQVGKGGEVPTAAVTTSAWTAGMSPAQTSGTVLRALYDRSNMSNRTRYLIKVLQDREEITRKLLGDSKVLAGTEHGGLEVLEMVFRTLSADGLSKGRAEEFTELLQEMALGDEIGGDRNEMARLMADRMIEAYRNGSRVLEKFLVELTTACQPKRTENAEFGAQECLEGRNKTEWGQKNERRVEASNGAEIRVEMERRFGPDLASRLMERLDTDIAQFGIIPEELCHPNASVRNRFLFDTFPVDGEYIYFRPPCLSSAKITPSQQDSTIASISQHFFTVPSNLGNEDQPLSLPHRTLPSSQCTSDFLNNVGRIRNPLPFAEGGVDDNSLPKCTSQYAQPDFDRIFNPKLPSKIPHRNIPNGEDGRGRFSLEGEVLASIAALAAASVNEARENEDALAESTVGANRGITEDYVKELRERTTREREERILKRARQISGQNPHLQAPRVRSGGNRVASGGGGGKDTVRSGASRLEHLRPLDLIQPGRQRIAGLLEDESQTGSRSRILTDVTGLSAPLNTVRVANDGSPVPVFNRYDWEGIRRGLFARSSLRRDERKGDSSTEKELDAKFQLPCDEAGQQSLSIITNQEERDRIFRSRQVSDEKIAPLEKLQKQLAEDFKLKRGEADEPENEVGREDNPVFINVRKRLNGDSCHESAEGPRSSAQQPKYIPKWQTPLERSVMVEAPRQHATLPSLVEPEASVPRAARNNPKTSFCKGHEKGSLDGVRFVMDQQSSSVGERSGEENKLSNEGLKDAMKKTSDEDSLRTGTISSPTDNKDIAARDKRYVQEEGPFSHEPRWLRVLVQFKSSASGFPQNFPWRSDGLMCGLFGIMSPITLPSLLSSLEAKVKKELEAMKASEGDPEAAAAGVAGLAWLADHKISGLTVLWNWRRKNYSSSVGSDAMPFSTTLSLRTKVTERNVDGALWMMSEERRPLLLVHTSQRDVEEKDDSKGKKKVSREKSDAREPNGEVAE